MRQEDDTAAAPKEKQRLLIQLETYRQSLCAGFLFALFLAGTALLCCAALILKSKSPDVGLPLLFTFASGCLGFSGWVKGKYLQKLKQSFFLDFIKGLWPQATYSPDKGITRQEFEAGKIFLCEINDYTSLNLISVQQGPPAFRLSNVTAAYYAYGAKSPAKVFQGLFLMADFNKNTRGQTYVLPDKAERLLGKPGQDLQSLSRCHGELVKTEDPDFEKYFVVYSTDQVEARYILSPAFMRNLSEFRREVNDDVFVSFIDGKMYLGISNGLLINDTSLFKPVSSDNLTSPFFSLIALHKLLANSLHTRIWTKE
jgi:hypothetical protein